MSKTVEPSIKETAFSCPHCGAFTTQFWYDLFADKVDGQKTPYIPKPAHKERLENDRELRAEENKPLLEWIDKMMTGLVFFESSNRGKHLSLSAQNLHISECYNCHKIAVWVNERLVFPEYKMTTQPNSDHQTVPKPNSKEAHNKQ